MWLLPWPMAEEDASELFSDPPGLRLKPRHVLLHARDEKRFGAVLAKGSCHLLDLNPKP